MREEVDQTTEHKKKEGRRARKDRPTQRVREIPVC